jgi:hypothetical protein
MQSIFRSNPTKIIIIQAMKDIAAAWSQPTLNHGFSIQPKKMRAIIFSITPKNVREKMKLSTSSIKDHIIASAKTGMMLFSFSPWKHYLLGEH